MKKILSLLVVLAMALCLVACGGTKEETSTEVKSLNVYGIYKGDGDYWRNEAKGTEEALAALATENGFEYTWHYLTCDNDPELTLTNVETAVADQADLILICVPDQNMSQAVVDRCNEAGTTVIAVDDGLIDGNGNKIAPWFGIDAYNIGVGCGTWLGNYAVENGLVDDPKCGLLIQTMETVSSCVPRTEGEEDAWAEIVGDKMADRTFYADYQSTAELAYDSAAAVITGHPEFDKWLVMNPSTNGTVGVVAVLEEQGLDKESCIMSLGADTIARQWDEDINCWDCVKQCSHISGGMIGAQAVTAGVNKILNGTEIPMETVVPAVFVDKTNYKEYKING